jgi:uncharacterized protein YeaO (DUF488 family)
VPGAKLKRAYDPPEESDGARYLVDRMWPRGVKKDALKIEAWLKDVAPTTALREWFHHDPEKWDEFRRRYFKELDTNRDAWLPLQRAANEGTLTLVYSARDTERNNAVVLAEYLKKHTRS